MSKKLIPALAALLLLCACSDADTPPGETPSPPAAAASAEPSPPALPVRDAESILLTVGGQEYTLTDAEAAEIHALLDAARAVVLSEAESPMVPDGCPELLLRCAGGAEETLYYCGDEVWCYTDEGCVMARCAQLDETVAGIVDAMLAPEVELGNVVRGEYVRKLRGGETQRRDVPLLDDILLRMQEILDIGILPHTTVGAASIENTLKRTGGIGDVLTFYDADGGEVISVSEYSNGRFLTVGGRYYKVSGLDFMAKLEELMRFAPQTVFLDENDPGEYALSNGLELGMSCPDVIARVGCPDSVEEYPHYTLDRERIYSGYYLMHYAGGMVLAIGVSGTEDGSALEPMETGALGAAQFLSPGSVVTARGVAVGDSYEQVCETYGVEARSMETDPPRYYSVETHSAAAAYDTYFVIQTHTDYVDAGDYNMMYFLFTDGVLTSILLRTPIAVDFHPPLYSPGGDGGIQR